MSSSGFWFERFGSSVTLLGSVTVAILQCKDEKQTRVPLTEAYWTYSFLSFLSFFSFFFLYLTSKEADVSLIFSDDKLT